MKNIGELITKAQKVQSQMSILQAKMDQQEFSGEAANGAVKVVMTGKGVPVSVKLDKSVVSADDVETLEDLLVVALRNVRENIDRNGKNAIFIRFATRIQIAILVCPLQKLNI